MCAKTEYEYAMTIVGNLKSALAASPQKTNTLNSATEKLKLLRFQDKERRRGPTFKTLQSENAKLLKALDLSKENLQRALNNCAKPDNITNRVNMFGKKGHRYNMYV
jgi:hypothetical protein